MSLLKSCKEGNRELNAALDFLSAFEITHLSEARGDVIRKLIYQIRETSQTDKD